MLAVNGKRLKAVSWLPDRITSIRTGLLFLAVISVLQSDRAIVTGEATTGGSSGLSRSGAATITVQNANDSGLGSLRDAIYTATPGDTINFAPAVISIGLISLTSGPLIIDKDLTVQGPGADQLTVNRANGSANHSVFILNSGATVTIEGLTVTNGRAVDSSGTNPLRNDGGGLTVEGAHLYLIGCVVAGNYAAGAGGGINVAGGSLSLDSTTVSGNDAPLGGGLMLYYGSSLDVVDSTISNNTAGNTAAIEIEDSTATLTNSTISGNFSTGGGGAINNAAGSGATSTLTMINCTVAYNRDHGVLTINAGGGVADTKLLNTIFENYGPNFKTINAGATLTSLGHNFDGDGTSGFTDGVNGDIVGNASVPKFARLGPLADNGGLTQTHALLRGSPAIDAGDDSAAPPVDQRDNFRTGPEADGNADDAVISDIGAFEVQKYLVNNVADSGPGSLRQALIDNNDYGGGLIAFDIPASGVNTITPMTPLPVITKNVLIDGYTQPGSRPNSQFFSDDAVLLVELNGSAAGLAEGIEIQTSHCTIRGLVINGFTNGVMLRGPGAFLNDIIGNYIGCDPTGMSPAPNIFAGINILEGAYSNVIGDQQPPNRNLISGNSGAGIFIQSTGTRRNFVLGNFIGLAADGVTGLGNTAGANAGFGILVGYGADNAIISNNFIAFNDHAGIGIYSDISAPAPIKNKIGFNYIYSNKGLGIDLGNDGVTPNDAGDADSGPNNLQNYPVITSVGSGLITGTLNSTPNSVFRVEFFASPTCDPSGHGQGEAVLGALDLGNAVVTDASGNASFSFSYTPFTGRPYITATATNNATEETSEFSACVSEVPPPPPPTITGVTVLDDLIIANGTGYVDPVQVLIDGVGFYDPAKVESQGTVVRQAGLLSDGRTIAQASPPGKTVSIEIVNSGGSRTAYSYARSRIVSTRGIERKPHDPPILLTSVVFDDVAKTVEVEGKLTGLAPNTTYTIYILYTPSGDGASEAKSCEAPTSLTKTIVLEPPIIVRTDSLGNALFRRKYPVDKGKGFINAIAIPTTGSQVPVTSNCLGPTVPPGPAIFEIRLDLGTGQQADDRIIVIGFGFSEPRVFINDIPFVDAPTIGPSPTIGQQLVQTGRLADGRAIRDLIKPGETVRIRVTNGNGGSTQYFFRYR